MNGRRSWSRRAHSWNKQDNKFTFFLLWTPLAEIETQNTAPFLIYVMLKKFFFIVFRQLLGNDRHSILHLKSYFLVSSHMVCSRSASSFDCSSLFSHKTGKMIPGKSYIQMKFQLLHVGPVSLCEPIKKTGTFQLNLFRNCNEHRNVCV